MRNASDRSLPDRDDETLWQLLDLLPTPQPDAELSRRTLEVANLGTVVREQGTVGRHEKRLRASELAALLVLAAATAYALMAQFRPDRRAEQSRDLDLLLRLDGMRAVGSYESLERLASSRPWIEGQP
jgi:hypothetical protein